MPKGFREKGHDPKVAVMFPEYVFKQIKIMAVQESKTFSEMVVELCTVGIFDLQESDACEPRRVFVGADQ